MYERVIFNVIETTKSEDINEIKKIINRIVNKLITNEFANRIN